MSNGRDFQFRFKDGGDFDIPTQTFTPIGAQDPEAANGIVGVARFPPQTEGFQQARPVDFPTEPGAGGVGLPSAQFPQPPVIPAGAPGAAPAAAPGAAGQQNRPLGQMRQRIQDATATVRARLMPGRDAGAGGPIASRLANFQPLARIRSR